MADSIKLTDLLKALPPSEECEILGCHSDGTMVKATYERVRNLAFSSVNSQDLNDPTVKGIYYVNQNTVIDRPTKGTGWTFGAVINLAVRSGIQIWINFDGYIAIRGKGNASGNWSEWSVMARL